MTAYIAEDGATGALVRELPWATTSLGPSNQWPSILRTTLSLVLSSRLPMCLWWGRDHVFFCNDASAQLIGRDKLQRAFGQPARAHWQHNWSHIEAELDSVWSNGEATWHENVPIVIERDGRVFEGYWTYSYSAVRDDDGVMRGVLGAFTETTQQVIKSRRLETMRMLLSEVAGCSDIDALLLALQRVTAAARTDLPLLLVYRRARNNAMRWEPLSVSRGVSGAVARTVSDQIAGCSMLTPETCASPLLTLEAPIQLDDIHETVDRVHFAVTPSTYLYAVVIGVHPRRPCDAETIAFFAQITTQIDLAFARLGALRERAFVESERRALLMQAPFPIALLVGPQLAYELANPAYARMVNRTELIGRPYLQVFPELKDSATERMLQRVLTTGEPFVAAEYPVQIDLQGNGVPVDVYFHAIVQPVRDALGEIYGLMVMAIDISEQVTARYAAQEAVTAIEASMTQKLELIAQLEAAAHAKDDFLAMVSHELRTPLTSIMGWARVLQTQRDDARLDKGLNAIERNARAQAKLIDDMLDVSRIIAGKVRMNIRWVDARVVAQTVSEMIRPLVGTKAIQLRVEVNDDLQWLKADEERLQQILWNLLTNAVKFTSPGGTITLRVSQDATNTIFTVEDTGQGIDATFLPHVFERFSQAEDGREKQRVGLGLGLAIVRELVDLHQGSVVARSLGKDRGACFEVKIPTRSQHAAPSTLPPPQRDTMPEALSADALHDLHALVVEDEDDARDFIATVLSDAGAQVTQTDSARQALTMLNGERFDVLLSDIGMPTEDGYALIERVRAPGQPLRIRGIPAVAVTAFSKPEDRRRALAAGFQDHLAKPIDPATLIDRVAAVVRRAS